MPAGLTSGVHLNRNASAVKASDSVAIASSSGCSRMAGTPTSTAVPAASTPPNSIASRNGTPCPVAIPVPKAPTPMNTAWHSDTCPTTPTSSTSDSTASPQTAVWARLKRLKVPPPPTSSGRTSETLSTPSSEATARRPVGSGRTGIGSRPPAEESRRPLCRNSTSATSTTTNAVSSSVPRTDGKVCVAMRPTTGCSIPRPIPPISVRGSDVSRPTSATASACTVKMISVVMSSLLSRGVTSTPASPLMPPPRPQATRFTRSTPMPSSRAASGASETARVAVPSAVKRKKAASPAMSAAAMRMTAAWSRLSR